MPLEIIGGHEGLEAMGASADGRAEREHRLPRHAHVIRHVPLVLVEGIDALELGSAAIPASHGGEAPGLHDRVVSGRSGPTRFMGSVVIPMVPVNHNYMVVMVMVMFMIMVIQYHIGIMGIGIIVIANRMDRRVG